jgi:DNA-binding GntR family transcriptional regulator
MQGESPVPFEREDKITEAQAEVWEHIISHVERFGYQPSLREMAEYFQVSAVAIRDRITQLARKGYVDLPPKYSERCLKLNNVKFEATIDVANT